MITKEKIEEINDKMANRRFVDILEEQVPSPLMQMILMATTSDAEMSAVMLVWGVYGFPFVEVQDRLPLEELAEAGPKIMEEEIELMKVLLPKLKVPDELFHVVCVMAVIQRSAARLGMQA